MNDKPKTVSNFSTKFFRYLLLSFNLINERFAFFCAVPENEYTVCIKDLGKLNLVKFPYGGKVLGSSRFSVLPPLPLEIALALKVVKSNSK